MATRVISPANLIRRMLRLLHHVHDSPYLSNLRHHHPSPHVRMYLNSLFLHVVDLIVYLLQQEFCRTASPQRLYEVNNYIHMIIRPLRRFLLQLRQAEAEQRRHQLPQAQMSNQQRNINITSLAITSLHGDVLVFQQHLFISGHLQNPYN